LGGIRSQSLEPQLDPGSLLQKALILKEFLESLVPLSWIKSPIPLEFLKTKRAKAQGAPIRFLKGIAAVHGTSVVYTVVKAKDVAYFMGKHLAAPPQREEAAFR
jgi:hypothetical protein